MLEFLAVERIVHRNKGSTLGVKKAAIRSAFEHEGLQDPTSGQRVKLVLRGMRREDGPPASKQPAMLRHLEGVYQDLQVKKLGSQGTAMWAAVCLGYFFTLRSRSYVAKNKGRGYNKRDILLRRDVHFVAGRGAEARVIKPTRENAHLVTRMIIRVKRSKTDQLGEGYERGININSHPYACAVKAVLAHLLVTPGLPGEYPVCCFDAKAAMRSTAQWTITRDEVSKALKGAAMRMGESTDDLGSHSLRIGGATALAAAGAPDSFICYWGFWKSPAYRGYLRHVKEDPWEHRLAEELVRQDLHTAEEQQKPKWPRPWGDKEGSEEEEG